jgi:hypothetical protein
MFHRTSHPMAPWRVVRADHKKRARLGLMRDLLGSFRYPGKKKAVLAQEAGEVFTWYPAAVKDGILAE